MVNWIFAPHLPNWTKAVDLTCLQRLVMRNGLVITGVGHHMKLALQMPNPGYIYVAFNSEMPHCVKVGLTTREPRQRLAELSGTSTPVPFRLLMQWRVNDTDAAESAAHQSLAHCRVASNREFFRVDGPDAILTVGRAIEPFLVSNDDSAIQHEISKACEEAARWFFTQDFRAQPPVSLSPETTEALQIEIRDRALWLARWATEDGANPKAIISVIALVGAKLSGAPQCRRSPTELARDFNSDVEMLMSLLSTSFYLQVGVGPYAAPTLNYVADVTNVISQALRLAQDDIDNRG